MSTLSRREFCVGAGAVAAGVLLGRARGSRAASRPGLPVPPELRADSSGTIVLAARPGRKSFLAGVETPTYGFNGPFLGPAIRVPRGRKVTVKVENGLGEEITLHWHGLIIPGRADGGPYDPIPPGGTWTVELPVDQPAATLWFHPHVYPATAELVIMGLAGLFLVDDEESDGLGLPSRWGVDDIPLILQDRRFSADGSFFHRFNEIAVAAGYVGDVMLVNGARQPVARTARGWLRFRILDGSNARNYRLAVGDGRSLYVVGSDGGLLPEPVELKELAISAGERYEVLVDARDGKSFDLVSLPVPDKAIMRLPPFDGALTLVSVRPEGAEGSGRLPDGLAALPSLPARLPSVSQRLVMQMYRDAEARPLMMESGLMAMAKSGEPDPAVVARVVDLISEGPALPLKDQLTANGINGAPFSFTQKGFRVSIGKELVWSISEGSDRMLHPVHIHGCQFRVVRLGGGPPPPQMAGWKDTLPIAAGQEAEIHVRFPLEAPDDSPYMAHCHILEHEDSGMMTEFSVG